MVDPISKEEAACSASVTVVMNAHNEVCLLNKAGGMGLSMNQVGVHYRLNTPDTKIEFLV